MLAFRRTVHFYGFVLLGSELLVCVSQLSSSVRPPGSSAASTTACVCRSPEDAMASTTVATTAMNTTAVGFKSKVTLAIPQKKYLPKKHVFACFPEAPPSTPICQKDEFQCSNGRCISSIFRCNYFNDCEDYGSDEINCNKKGVCRAAVPTARFHCRFNAHRFIPAPADTALNDCRSNRTVCGDGDEAHCMVNGTDSFCSCRSGFQSNGRNRCEGALVFISYKPFVYVFPYPCANLAGGSGSRFCLCKAPRDNSLIEVGL